MLLLFSLNYQTLKILKSINVYQHFCSVQNLIYIYIYRYIYLSNEGILVVWVGNTIKLKYHSFAISAHNLFAIKSAFLRTTFISRLPVSSIYYFFQQKWHQLDSYISLTPTSFCFSYSRHEFIISRLMRHLSLYL